MDIYDDAEICELVEIFILKSLEDKIDKQGIGLYRDDGLMILRNANGQKTDRTRKYIIKIMKDLAFQTEIETNPKEVNFLDVTFNLNSRLYKPYKKSNDHLLYVATSSNQPPQVIKQLPNSINRKLIENSLNKAVFDASKNEYEEVLLKSGYKSNLEFQKEISSEKKNKSRSRNIIWFNPPFNPPFYNHKKSIKSKTYRNDTTLSSYLWDLREKHSIFPMLTWSVVKPVPRYSNISKRCFSCLSEKVLIATYENPEELLHKRSELIAKCRHDNKFLLSHYKSND